MPGLIFFEMKNENKIKMSSAAIVISALLFKKYSLFTSLISLILREVSDSKQACISCKLQSNFNSSNTDGSFTMADSKSCLSSYEILSTDQENKYLKIFLGMFLILSLNCMCIHIGKESHHRGVSNEYT